MFYVEAPVKRFREVEFRCSLTVFKRSLILRALQMGPEVASCRLLGFPSPVQQLGVEPALAEEV